MFSKASVFASRLKKIWDTPKIFEGKNSKIIENNNQEHDIINNKVRLIKFEELYDLLDLYKHLTLMILI